MGLLYVYRTLELVVRTLGPRQTKSLAYTWLRQEKTGTERVWIENNHPSSFSSPSLQLQGFQHNPKINIYLV